MSARVVVAGLLVGVLGIVTLAAAVAVEHFTFKQVGTFIQNHPEAFPLPPDRAILWTMGLTIWVGLLFGFLYQQAWAAGGGPRQGRGWRSAAGLGLLCWLGLAAPFLALQLLWTRTSLYVLGTAAVGFLLQFVLGGAVLARILQPEASPAPTPGVGQAPLR